MSFLLVEGKRDVSRRLLPATESNAFCLMTGNPDFKSGQTRTDRSLLV
jgi:NADPH-dependent 7-cyano-7-deazaguanine reductase QueF